MELEAWKKKGKNSEGKTKGVEKSSVKHFRDGSKNILSIRSTSVTFHRGNIAVLTVKGINAYFPTVENCNDVMIYVNTDTRM